jgi:hypothetical protein
MKTNLFILLSISVFAILKQGFTYPSGAPLDRCNLNIFLDILLYINNIKTLGQNMMPGHGYDPLETPSPYQITVNPISSNELNGNYSKYII